MLQYRIQKQDQIIHLKNLFIQKKFKIIHSNKIFIQVKNGLSPRAMDDHCPKTVFFHPKTLF